MAQFAADTHAPQQIRRASGDEPEGRNQPVIKVGDENPVSFGGLRAHAVIFIKAFYQRQVIMLSLFKT